MTDADRFSELLDQAKAQVRQRQFTSALDLFRQAQSIDDDSVELHEAIATTCVMAGDLEQAIEHFRRVTLLAPRKSAAFVNLGALYNRTGEYKKAVEMCRKAVQVDRKCADGYYNLGIAEKKLNQLALAIPAYREAIRLKPDFADAHLNLGNVFLEMDNVREALLHFTKALEIRPDFARARAGLEKAQRRREEGKVSYSPFGRLVNTETLSAQQDAWDTSNLRALTDDERDEDHQILSVINRTIARAAKSLRDQLRQKLIPEIKELDIAVGCNGEVQQARANFKPIAVQFQTACKALQAAVEELRQHETRMRARQQTPPA